MQRKTWLVIGAAVLGICVCLCLAGGFLTMLSPTREETDLAAATNVAWPVAQPSATAKATPAPTVTPGSTRTATAVPAQSISQIARGEFGDHVLRATSQLSGTQTVALIEYSLRGDLQPRLGNGPEWVIGESLRDLLVFAPDFFKADPSSYALALHSFSLQADRYGNPTPQKAVKYTIRRQTAAKVNWDNIPIWKLGRIVQQDDRGLELVPELMPTWILAMSQLGAEENRLGK